MEMASILGIGEMTADSVRPPTPRGSSETALTPSDGSAGSLKWYNMLCSTLTQANADMVLKQCGVEVIGTGRVKEFFLRKAPVLEQ